MNLINYAIWVVQELKVPIYLVRKHNEWNHPAAIRYDPYKPRPYAGEQFIEIDEEGFFTDTVITRWFSHKDSTDLQYIITPALIIRFQLTGELS